METVYTDGDLVSHIIYFSEGNYTEFWCGKEANTSDLREIYPIVGVCATCAGRYLGATKRIKHSPAPVRPDPEENL